MGGQKLKGRTYEEIHGVEKAKELRQKRSAARWKGGRYDDGDYWYVYQPDHPCATNGGYVPEHILIAERVLGRPLKRDNPRAPDAEVVHHLNGDGHDNRPENLLVCQRWFHTKIHQAIRNFFELRHFSDLQHAPARGEVFTSVAVDEYLGRFGLDPSKVRFLGEVA